MYEIAVTITCNVDVCFSGISSPRIRVVLFFLFFIFSASVTLSVRPPPHTRVLFPTKCRPIAYLDQIYWGGRGRILYTCMYLILKKKITPPKYIFLIYILWSWLSKCPHRPPSNKPLVQAFPVNLFEGRPTDFVGEKLFKGAAKRVMIRKRAQN